ncbi:2',5' RNA ligase (plasmid) [[Synechococcus] sp. NIES-970]|nr:2',5' RNA ligase [[Synechococcus] sp. NIES-970]
MEQQLFFVALILPPDLGAIANGWQYYCVDHFQTKKALNSPPHITLQPPFKLPAQDFGQLQNLLQTFAQSRPVIPIQLIGFNCFPPRVIYLDVECSQKLLNCQSQLKNTFAEKLQICDQRYGDRPFRPHVTLAFKDLSRDNFARAWAFFQGRSLDHNFVAQGVSLLQHNGRHWQMSAYFPFRGQS